MNNKITETQATCLTIGDTTYKTSGNILFAKEEGCYYLAESALLDNVDKAIENGILGNGMMSFLNKFKK